MKQKTNNTKPRAHSMKHKSSHIKSAARSVNPETRKPNPAVRSRDPEPRLPKPAIQKQKHATRDRNDPVSFHMVAKTFYGLEDLLAEELTELGAQHVRKLNRAVDFDGDKKLMYRVNYGSRLSLKILVHIKTAEVKDENALYHCIRGIRWDRYLGLKDTFVVEAVLKSSAFSHSHYVEQRIKDAVADQFRDRYNQRPSVDLADPDLKIHANITGHTLRLSLDSSGQPLFKRGYRTGQGAAPLNEVLAAGLIRLSGWTAEVPFVDFMCGSGTLPVEAALIALNIPPGALGRKYGFQYWKDYDPSLFNEVTNEFRSGASLKRMTPAQDKISISASDLMPSLVNLAKRNAGRAGVEPYIRFSAGHFNTFRAVGESGLILVNPPYGERLKQENLNELYALLGNKLKKDFNGYEAWIFSGNKEALKHVGLRTAQRLTLYNGPLECRFHRFLMYEGSKKEGKSSA